MRRVAIVGATGSGKSSLASALADRLGAPHVELDAIFHQPGWVPLEPGEFRRRVGEAVAGDRWVIDGNYSVVRDLVWGRADTVVWLDYPRWVVMRRVVGRTLRRVARREVLWNGNREPFGNLTMLHDPERSIIAWAWARHPVYRRRYAGEVADPRWAHLRFVRLEDPGEATALLDAVTESG